MGTIEKLMGHYRSLKEKHDKLDSEIENSFIHHESDEKIHEMKKQKLHLKEQMFEIEQKLGLNNGKTILHGNK